LTKIETPDINVVDELDDTNRGVGGFGSTGLKGESQTVCRPLGESMKENQNASVVESSKQVAVEAEVFPPLCIKLHSEDAKEPARGSAGAAGYDLFAAKDIMLPARGKCLVPTDVSMAIPDGYYGRIAPRSSVSWKHHIDVGAGVIDADYRGTVGVVLFNLADTEFSIEKHMRVAQLVLTKIETPDINVVDELDDTNRGVGGFGSTGLKGEAVKAK
jgi:dUTP pyrophosphatase